MPTFTIKNQKPSTSVIEFEASIDEDGDFSVSANGIHLFFIRKESGKLNLYSVHDKYLEEHSGLKFDDHKLVVSS